MWAAGLGIVGTLVGALGGGLLQARAVRRQVMDQEAAEVRHRLRDERKAAFISLLDKYEAFDQAITPLLMAHQTGETLVEDVAADVWRDVEEALVALGRARSEVDVAGTARISQLAEELQRSAEDQVRVMRVPDLPRQLRRSMLVPARSSMATTRYAIVREAQKSLAAPHQARRFRDRLSQRSRGREGE